MTLLEIETSLARRFNKNTTLDTAVKARLRAFINERHRELLTLPDCSQFRDDMTTFATVADQSRYALPQAVARVHRMWDGANERNLTEITMSQYRRMSPDPTLRTGNPEAFAVQGITRTAKQPSAATALWADSDAAGDTQVLRIEGVVTGGYQQVANVTLTGTTAVQIGTLATWIQIDNIYLASAAAGNVTVLDAAAGNELARIPIGDLQPQYWTVHIWPTPSDALTLTMDYAREVRDMDQDTDSPLLPADFHRVLEYGAALDECLKLDDDRASYFQGLWKKGCDDLAYWIHARSSFRPGGPAVSRGGSNLGAHYPAGYW